MRPYLILPAALLLQVHISPVIPFFPDLALLLVVYAAVFRGIIYSVVFAMVAAVFRSFFSADTLPADIAVLPLIAVLSNLSTKMFDRRDIVFHLALSALSMALLISSHVVYFNSLSDIPSSAVLVALRSWPVILCTALVSPFVFVALNKSWRGRR